MTGASPGYSPPTACKCTASGTISLPSQGFFSPFPHGTGSLSVTREYLALRDGPRRFPRDFTCPAVLRNPTQASIAVIYRAVTVYGRSFQDRSISKLVGNLPLLKAAGPYNPDVHAHRFGLCPRSLAATSGITIVFCSCGY